MHTVACPIGVCVGLEHVEPRLALHTYANTFSRNRKPNSIPAYTPKIKNHVFQHSECSDRWSAHVLRKPSDAKLRFNNICLKIK